MTRPPGFMINDEGIERGPAILMAPLRDLAQKLPNGRLEMSKSGLLTQITVLDQA